MLLYEYEAKASLKHYGIPVFPGEVTSSADKIITIIQDLGVPVIIKLQSAAEKLRPAHIAYNLDEALNHIRPLLSDHQKVHKVLIEPFVPSNTQLFLEISNNYTLAQPVMRAFILTPESSNQDAVQEAINPLIGLHDYQIRNIAGNLSLPEEHWDTFSAIARNLYRCFIESDATQVEINPLVITVDNSLVAQSCSMSIDDNALFRHGDLAINDIQRFNVHRNSLRSNTTGGKLGCIVNGMGPKLAIMDMLSYRENGPDIASIMDIGSATKVAQVTHALEILLAQPEIQVILIQLAGGSSGYDIIAEAIIKAYEKKMPPPTLIAHFQGAKASLGKELLLTANIPVLLPASLSDAVQLALTTIYELR